MASDSTPSLPTQDGRAGERVPPRLSIVTLGVADVESSAAFYAALGWQRSSASVPGEIVWFKITGSVLGLFGRKELAEDAALPLEPRAPFGGVTLAINVETEEEVQAAIDAAVAVGGAQLKPATRLDWGGLSGYFADPDGHPWEVAWNPGFGFRPDGTLDLP